MLLRKILYIFIQWTWGLPQSLIGLILLLVLGKHRHEWYGYAMMTVYDKNHMKIKRFGCVSLGMFTFVNASADGCANPEIAAHEYGHTFQSLLLGPLYLLAVGIPSSLWALYYMKHRKELAAKGILYPSRYPENWAEHWGKLLAVQGVRDAD